MYEYSIETVEIPGKFFTKKNNKELDGLLELINKKSEDGWELVTNTFMGLSNANAIQTFVCTFKREKK